VVVEVKGGLGGVILPWLGAWGVHSIVREVTETKFWQLFQLKAKTLNKISIRANIQQNRSPKTSSQNLAYQGRIDTSLTIIEMPVRR
jgi:hypothetical protein